ncbi:UDP-N-acetylglucosamine--N-acetylmuramyl-(pentapeptide) pyrophosphoryl-undecaprenol N-acetylglucosamine transferase [endosymbiont of Euscepes postfasciatus]|uniref:UDP-N-acetylglucosamine--N-acetylmuramyl- (pentapeptide) pyrophosphoryl-undecaprenol N-acetylglucosamine transferase n=1 Tax=endosymbiont of Euscepes postfasciatus TaxID=650377 RepID=UPI000DC6E9B9|nr:UDP-N-acetylglucosamine--N-acetylmuramyl-(pentapeptide) pyrophosphoryl-undecaprenol N-acetylglucosamine transferase [endosymbiont of Euscepes postfasciatus]BBA84556.1 UDP-N-acetylglucosamine--N-acetylmuramyl-(pentapeptide) pyrophosphoryl-undecaprenol N-acetylglucosamine transferase [endosymbiont of Euscepes postfasciatus]
MNKKIIIVSGGTAGHIIPSIIIGKELEKKKWNVYWATIKENLFIFINYKIPLYKILIINCINFRKINLFKKILFSFLLFKIIIESLIIINKIKPNLILGMGNYISFYFCISSKILNIPIIIHEQNFILGLSNKILLFFSKKVLSGFKIKKINKKIIFTGNPIRKSILNIKNIYLNINKKKGPINILILGGSQGSNFINELIIDLLIKFKLNIKIWHQTGDKNFIYFISKYKKLNLTNYLYKINGFIYNINKAFLWSDIVISRSGASIVNEISYIGLPSIFIPYPTNDNHQYFNAIYLKNKKISKIIIQSECTVNKLYKYLFNINRKILFNMSYNYNMNYLKNNNCNPNDLIISEIINYDK